MAVAVAAGTRREVRCGCGAGAGAGLCCMGVGRGGGAPDSGSYTRGGSSSTSGRRPHMSAMVMLTLQRQAPGGGVIVGGDELRSAAPSVTARRPDPAPTPMRPPARQHTGAYPAVSLARPGPLPPTTHPASPPPCVLELHLLQHGGGRVPQQEHRTHPHGAGAWVARQQGGAVGQTVRQAGAVRLGCRWGWGWGRSGRTE